MSNLCFSVRFPDDPERCSENEEKAVSAETYYVNLLLKLWGERKKTKPIFGLVLEDTQKLIDLLVYARDYIDLDRNHSWQSILDLFNLLAGQSEQGSEEDDRDKVAELIVFYLPCLEELVRIQTLSLKKQLQGRFKDILAATYDGGFVVNDLQFQNGVQLITWRQEGLMFLLEDSPLKAFQALIKHLYIQSKIFHYIKDAVNLKVLVATLKDDRKIRALFCPPHRDLFTDELLTWAYEWAEEDFSALLERLRKAGVKEEDLEALRAERRDTKEGNLQGGFVFLLAHGVPESPSETAVDEVIDEEFLVVP